MNKFTNLIIIFLFSIVTFSCNDAKDSGMKQLILGEWHAIEIEDLDAFIFQEDSVCLYKPGFFSYIDDAKWTEIARFNMIDIAGAPTLHINPFFGCVKRFLGYETTYDIQRDSLFVFDLALQGQRRYEINFISTDTLQLTDGKEEKVFVRKQYEQDNGPLFDRVIVNFEKDFYPPDSGQAMRSFCQSDYFKKLISIDQSGEAMYYTVNHQESKPFQAIGRIDSCNLRYLESLYKQACLNTLLNETVNNTHTNNSGIWRDDFPEITFVKDNEMHSIRYPLHVFGTKEFLYAYVATLFSDQLFIAPTIQSTDTINLFKLNLEFKQGKESLTLSFTEEFYLSTLIYKAKETTESFTPKYSINAYEPILNYNQVSILSDGRYYRFKNKQGEWITLDIGFNFIENNKLEEQFE